jgi:hypothetical protein
VAQQTYTIADLSSTVRTAYDPYCTTAILGYTKQSSTSTATGSGYRVQIVLF